jgi:hypothetical protein
MGKLLTFEILNGLFRMDRIAPILVHSFQGALFRIDNIPIGTQVSSVISRLASLDLPGRPPKTDLAVTVNNRILEPTDEMTATEITLVAVHHRSSTFVSLIFAILFIWAHGFTGVLLYRGHFFQAVSLYLPLILGLGLLMALFPGRPFPVAENPAPDKSGILHVLMRVFVYSLNPGFR